MTNEFERYEASKEWSDIVVGPQMKLSHVSFMFLALTSSLVGFDAQAQNRIHRCGNEYTLKIEGRKDCILVEGGNVEIEYKKPDVKRAKRPSGEITPKDFRRLKAEAQENVIRFDAKYSNMNFSAKATLSSVSARRTLPGYLVSFKSEGVGIVCLLKDKASLDFVKDLNMGDVVSIKANFQEKGFLQNDYFSVDDCKLSK